MLLAHGILLEDRANAIIKALESNLVEFNRYQYIEKATLALPEPVIQVLKSTLSTLTILQKMADTKKHAMALTQLSDKMVCEVFDAMFVTAKTPHEEEEQAKAEDNEALSLQISQRAAVVWDSLVSAALLDNSSVQSTLIERVKRSITDIQYSASPSDSVRRINKLLAVMPSSTVADILGAEQDWKALSSVPLGQHTNEYLTLGLVDVYASVSVEPLVDDLGELRPVAYDIYGLSSFARFALFLGEYLSDALVRRAFFAQGDRDWVVRQLMVVCIACEQGFLAPDVCRLWEVKAMDGVRVFVQSVNHVFNDWLTEALSNVDDVASWNNTLIESIQAKTAAASQDRLANLVAQLMLTQASDHPALSAQLLQRVLQRLVILLDWQTTDAEKWLPLIKAESEALDLLSKVSILTSFKGILSSTDSFKHYQSDLSSKLSGISSQEQFDYDVEDPDLKKKKNWSILALLNASSLKLGSFDIPRQRLMYLIQGIRPLLNDEDADFSSDQQKARVQAQLAQLLKHLAESVQDVSGSHWSLFLQCCYGWITLADTTQPEELLVVYHALDLFHTLYLLSGDADNDELQDAVQDMMPALSKSLLQLMANEEKYLQQHKREEHHPARLVYQTLLSDLLEHIPEKTLIDSDCFDNVSSVFITLENEQLYLTCVSVS